MLTRIRENLAPPLSKVMKQCFGDETPAELLTDAKVVLMLAVPKTLDHGHLCLPVFSFSKICKKSPQVLASELSGLIRQGWSLPAKQLKKVEPLGGYVNFYFQDAYLQEVLFQECVKKGVRLGYTKTFKGKKMVIDYSSPNVAKPMHIGHLRATVIGQSIRNLAETQGYHVIGLNHLGDWGVQFGKLAYAFQNWYPRSLEELTFEELYQLYVKFHDESAINPKLEDEGSAVFKKLETGDAEIKKLWLRFVEISLADCGRVWQMMNVQHDLVRGESFYNDRLSSVEAKLESMGLLRESEGAMVVELGDDMPPCLIRKTDGASLYATRDLASAIYRHDELKADLNIYVVGSEQTLHFKQIFRVLQLMKFDWWVDCHHIGFGMYRFKDLGKISSRKGNIIRLEDVLTQAIEHVRSRIEAKNPQLKDKETVARQVGIGAVVFNDLAFDRQKNVEFDWERVLDFEGDSGPYVQYCHVRCVSVLRKHAEAGGIKIDLSSSFAELSERDERELILHLLQFEESLSAAFSQFRPNIVAHYLLETCRRFNQFYQNCRILGESPEVSRARLALVEAVQKVLWSGLKVLNIEAPEAM